MLNVITWFRLDESRKLEDQVKHFIAVETEGYLNGIHDCGLEEYCPMTREGWIEYIKTGLTLAINENLMINGQEFKHLRFYGNDKIEKLIETFIDNYSAIQPFIIKK